MTGRLNGLLQDYAISMRNLFGEELAGIYLTGSVCFGEFYEGKSDADCTVLLKTPLEAEKLHEIKKIHLDIASRYRGILLESQYISVDNIGKCEADTQPFYSCHENEISSGKSNASEVTWFTLKNHGITVWGMPADEIDIATSVSEVKAYVKANVNGYWRYWLSETRKPASSKRKLALTNWAVEWCVCGITRMYFTMMEGDITAKGKAAEYGLTCLPESTHKILKEALRIRRCERGGHYDSRYIRRREMIEYMEYIIEQIQNLPVK